MNGDGKGTRPRQRILFALLVASTVFVAGIVALSSTTPNLITNGSYTCLNQSSSPSSTPRGIFASAVGPSVYFNNSVYYQTIINFTVSPGSHSGIMVNVSYPWQNVQPSPAPGPCLEFRFTIGPFPAYSNSSTIPNWMHVSVFPPSVDILYGSSASVSLLASVNSSAPRASEATFELMINYFDPASGHAATSVYVLSIQT